MSETPPSGEKLPLSPEENAQLLHLSQDCSNNLRHAKAQQWQTGYLTLLAYGALVTAARVLTDSSPPLPAAWPYFFMSIWSVLSFVAGAFGIVVIWDLQMWMGRLRKSMGDAEVHFSEKYKKIASPCGKDEYYRSVFYKSMQAWLISYVIVIGWLVALFMIVVTFGAR